MFTDGKRKKIIFSMLRYLLLLLIVFSILYPILGVFLAHLKQRLNFLVQTVLHHRRIGQILKIIKWHFLRDKFLLALKTL